MTRNFSKWEVLIITYKKMRTIYYFIRRYFVLAYSGKVLSYYYIVPTTGLDRFQSKFTLSIVRRIQELDRFYIEGAFSDRKYLSWMKYEINHFILDFIRFRKYEQLELFVDSIKSVSYLHSFNLTLLNKFRTVYVALIYLHKIKFKIEKKLHRSSKRSLYR